MTQPEIRFNGFSDEWVGKKLGDVLKVPKKVEATVTTNEQLLTVKLHGGGVHVMPSNKLLKLGSTKYYVRKAGQLIYGKQNFFNGSMAIIPLELDGKASSGDVPSFDIVNADTVYLYQKISQPDFYKRTEDWASGTGSKRLHEKTIQQFPIQLPALPEQQKIGALFSKYDAIIALREQKLAELNALKKGMLQQTFPKNGEKVPELQFAGFADDWEERKLINYTKLITKGTTPKDKTGSGIVNFVKVENLSDGKISPIQKITEEEHEGYLKRSRLEEGDMLFSIAGTLGRTAIVNKSILPANTNQALAIIRSYDFDKYFLVTTLTGHVVAEYIRKNPTVGAQPNLSLEQVGQLIINTPIKGEQKKIGQLFKHLDARISNEQSKIEQLKAQKQGLLQRML